MKFWLLLGLLGLASISAQELTPPELCGDVECCQACCHTLTFFIDGVPIFEDTCLENCVASTQEDCDEATASQACRAGQAFVDPDVQSVSVALSTSSVGRSDYTCLADDTLTIAPVQPTIDDDKLCSDEDCCQECCFALTDFIGGVPIFEDTCLDNCVVATQENCDEATATQACRAGQAFLDPDVQTVSVDSSESGIGRNDFACLADDSLKIVLAPTFDQEELCSDLQCCQACCYSATAHIGASDLFESTCLVNCVESFQQDCDDVVSDAACRAGQSFLDPDVLSVVVESSAFCCMADDTLKIGSPDDEDTEVCGITAFPTASPTISPTQSPVLFEQPLCSDEDCCKACCEALAEDLDGQDLFENTCSINCVETLQQDCDEESEDQACRAGQSFLDPDVFTATVENAGLGPNAYCCLADNTLKIGSINDAEADVCGN